MMPYNSKADQAKNSRRWYRENKSLVLERKRNRTKKAREYILNTKQNQCCTTCGVQYNRYVLDYHHRPGTVKRYTLSEMPSRNSSIKAIEIEISKCDLICANCHREHTFNGHQT